ncbi:MAG: hypothetical protein RL607_2401 [Bacteroidota bacterium]|jgi:hypothetical protein
MNYELGVGFLLLKIKITFAGVFRLGKHVCVYSLKGNQVHNNSKF